MTTAERNARLKRILRMRQKGMRFREIGEVMSLTRQRVYQLYCDAQNDDSYIPKTKGRPRKTDARYKSLRRRKVTA